MECKPIINFAQYFYHLHCIDFAIVTSVNDGSKSVCIFEYTGYSVYSLIHWEGGDSGQTPGSSEYILMIVEVFDDLNSTYKSAILADAD